MKVGDEVRLRKPRIKATAKIKFMNKASGVLLDKRLLDFQWWHQDDLEVVLSAPSTTTSSKGKE